MRKLNRQELKEAADWLNIAFSTLAKFDCSEIDCKECPMWYREECAAVTLSTMSIKADALVEEAENGNH